MKTPTLNELASIKDISVVNVFSEYVFSVIDSMEGDSYADQARQALDQHLSEQARHWFFVTNFLSLWSNGGMQETLLCDIEYIEAKNWELKNAVAGFKAFGCNETAAFIEELIPKAEAWSTTLAKLNKREEAGEEVPEKEFDAVWDEVDAYDEPFDRGFDNDPDVYEAMTQDVQNSPEKYIPA